MISLEVVPLKQPRKSSFELLVLTTKVKPFGHLYNWIHYLIPIWWYGIMVNTFAFLES